VFSQVWANDTSRRRASSVLIVVCELYPDEVWTRGSPPLTWTSNFGHTRENNSSPSFDTSLSDWLVDDRLFIIGFS
jgi:hypothetical protein